MGKQRWKVWLTGRDASREDIVRALEAAGCEVTLGRLFTDSWHYAEDELAEKVRGMDAIMISTGDGNITRRVMEAGGKLRVIAKRAIGVGHGVGSLPPPGCPPLPFGSGEIETAGKLTNKDKVYA
ncbi:unnamed protein product, partial [marine sediment metagenome]